MDCKIMYPGHRLTTGILSYDQQFQNRDLKMIRMSPTNRQRFYSFNFDVIIDVINGMKRYYVFQFTDLSQNKRQKLESQNTAILYYI
jgi:hypothetical protein